MPYSATHSIEAGGRASRPAAFLMMAVLLISALFSEQLFFAMLSTVLFILLLPFASILTIAFLALLLGLNVPVSEAPIQLPGFKL